jgi:Ni,Fe-hydrogenase I cytochrome b subunit
MAYFFAGKGAKRVPGHYPISADFLYLFFLIISLLIAAGSALIFLGALREGDEARAWLSVAYFAGASLMAIFSFWWLC